MPATFQRKGRRFTVHPDAQLALMDDWNVRTHTGSGFVNRVKASTMGERDAELATIEFPENVGACG